MKKPAVKQTGIVLKPVAAPRSVIPASIQPPQTSPRTLIPSVQVSPQPAKRLSVSEPSPTPRTSILPPEQPDKVVQKEEPIPPVSSEPAKQPEMSVRVKKRSSKVSSGQQTTLSYQQQRKSLPGSIETAIDDSFKYSTVYCPSNSMLHERRPTSHEFLVRLFQSWN